MNKKIKGALFSKGTYEIRSKGKSYALYTKNSYRRHNQIIQVGTCNLFHNI